MPSQGKMCRRSMGCIEVIECRGGYGCLVEVVMDTGGGHRCIEERWNVSEVFEMCRVEVGCAGGGRDMLRWLGHRDG